MRFTQAVGCVTEKLYLWDSYLREVVARVTGVEESRGRRAYVLLDRTIFHPLFGGQPSDTGVIAAAGRVFEVKKAIVRGDEVLHYGVFAGKYSFEVGEEVVAKLDWGHRYLVMRLHTAGHILDYAVARVHGRLVETLSAFHGPPRAYLEYMLEEEPRVDEIAAEANRIVAENRPVLVTYVEASKLGEVVYNAPNLSRVPAVEKLRIVEIKGVNAMPCTGTHVKSTAEVGPITVDSVEKTERGWKIYYSVGPGGPQTL